ncbi:MAG: outer membrane beta-barrel protein [Flavobacteriales bacterium]|jgi:hypothetical protein|nr:outer membrane beta-barrel protein [Flavobacteriales bacterium]MBK7248763.1 outer membrane beta-barrel protein [Flavobacteriales bacterium]MBK9599309.1 outer membrane beta-barrel protein [Flavobacteriales bacterium]QQS74000.1 MAG: outer membrane beta-barrel protein [Flavobacteriales bacterium]HQV39996.1 hypothetical protein [Flavobacteriales bacterium]
MSLNEEFDELARRKLEERQFAFQEADWQGARKLIDAQRGGGNKAMWITGAVALLLVGGLAWYGTNSTGTERAVAAVEQVAPPSLKTTAVDQPAQNKSTTPMGTPPEPNAPAVAADMVAPSIRSIPVHSEDRATDAPTALDPEAEKSAPRKKMALNTSVGDQPTVVASKKNVAISSRAIPENEKENAATSPAHTATSTSSEEASTEPTLSKDGEAVTASPPTIASSAEPLAGTTTSTEPLGADTPENAAAAPVIPVDNQGMAAASGTVPNAAPKTPGNTQQQVPDAPENETNTSTSPAHNGPLAQVTLPGATAPTGNTGAAPSTTADPTTSDSASTAVTTATTPEDSATAAAPAATPPPLVPERAPWEISIMGGMFSSTTKYAGSNSADWNADIGKENSIGIGAELMHMGRNFGIGTGLHYSTYAERLHTDAVDRNTMTLQNFWYLMPVDTMVLVITDTIAGTPPTYTGTSENTTVHVLTQGTDTTTTTERIREARNELSRVSYIEVPLLLDAHLVQGRWSFGLRGGPTLGLLTGRRGTVPAPDNEGYVNFTDQPFRELVFGYMARAYIRYRFNAAWSVGIEPAMRGQLMNSLGSGDLDRKANSKGVMLSLSYRLR